MRLWGVVGVLDGVSITGGGISERRSVSNLSVYIPVSHVSFAPLVPPSPPSELSAFSLLLSLQSTSTLLFASEYKDYEFLHPLEYYAIGI